jgi:monoterpene epsilon-lactone hydrolase
MVMSDRPKVKSASWPVAAVDIAGLASSFAGAIGRLPFRDPWRGTGSKPRNLAVSLTRELVRSLLGYASSLPIDEFRSLEAVLDGIAGQVLPPFVALQGVATYREVIGGVPGIWFRPRGSNREQPDHLEGQEWPGTIVYLHGGGYIGTSPRMYALFMAHLARIAQCAIYVADYRLAPEFPFPAAVDDVCSVITALRHDGLNAERLIIAGDSGGGGLVGTVLHEIKASNLGRPGAVLLFSPEVCLTFSEDSVMENAPFDVLPWNIPVNSYLHGMDPHDKRVDVLLDDIAEWPPTFLAYGANEMFRDAIRELAEKIHAANIPHDISEVEGMFHVFPFLLPWAQESRDVYRRAADFLAETLAKADGWKGDNPCRSGPSAPRLCDGLRCGNYEASFPPEPEHS